MQGREPTFSARTRVVAALCLLVSSKAFGADGFCYVSGVERTAAGVAIYLTQPQRVFVAGSSGRGGPYVKDSGGQPALAGVVSAVLGDRLSFNTGPHSSCLVDVVLKDGKIGADVRGAIGLPGGGSGGTSVKFIVAE